MKIDTKPEAPKEPTAPEEKYVYTGEKNYEPPKVDPWVSSAATAAEEQK